MKRIILWVILFFLFFGIVPGQAQSSSAGFDMSNSPQWAKDLRRGEIVAFGSLPFTMFTTNFITGMFRWGNRWEGWTGQSGRNTAGFDFTADSRKYAPWPLKSSEAVEMHGDDKLINLGIAAGGAVVIAVVDHLIVRYKRNKRDKEIQAMTSTPIIIRRPLETAFDSGLEILYEPPPEAARPFNDDNLYLEFESEFPDAP